jgi:hypothetical protein
MDLYFSHSYRDERINEYFCNEFGEHGFKLYADQKSPVWCVAKLERYLDELTGFISIIPRRATDDGSLAYSPYIGHELSLARRGRVPRLLFVDDDLLGRFPRAFPGDAVPFVYGSPESGQFRHRQALESFRDRLRDRHSIRHRVFKDRQATILTAIDERNLDAAEGVREALSRNYQVTFFRRDEIGNAFDNNALIERLLASELCVFLSSSELGNTDIANAMAHAEFVPSIRLLYVPDSTDTQPSLSGQISWAKVEDLLRVFQEQLDGFRQGFVNAVNLVKIGTTAWSPASRNLWDPHDGAALANHLAPSDPFVRDRVEIVGKMLGGLISMVDRTQVWGVVRALYDELKRRHFYYERELKMSGALQAIRTPADISRAGSATCIDVTCLFASLLQAANQTPLIAVIEIEQEGKSRAHSLVGYLPPSGLALPEEAALEDLRAALDHEDAIFLESTGFLESEQPVGAETAEERLSGGNVLDFVTARQAAERLIKSDIGLRFVRAFEAKA